MSLLNVTIHEAKVNIAARKINRVKYFGIGTNIKQYQEILKGLFPAELLEQIADNHFGRTENFPDDFAAYINRDLSREELMKVAELLEDSFDKGGKRVVDIKGNKLQVGKIQDKRSLQALMSNQRQYLKNLSAEITRKIYQVLKQGFENGESVVATKKALVESVGALTNNRASMIARSEFIKASAMGTRQAMREAGIKRIAWLTARDSKVCPICQKLDGQTYPIDEAPIPVKDTHPNCRCCVIARL